MSVVAVVVTFRPEGDCAELVSELARQCDDVVVVDNGSGPETVQQLSATCHAAGAHFVPLDENVGIAAAQNIGIEVADSLGADFALLSDDDSLPSPGMVEGLVHAIEEDPLIAATGPLPAEDREGGDQLVYCARTWGPKRAHPEELAQERLDVAFLIASGCLIRLETLKVIGPMNGAMFIDHVDLEWGLRARQLGHRLVCVPAIGLHHSLGDEVVQLPNRPQPIHVHAPFRNYYILRNTISLIKRDLMPVPWRIRYAYWAAKYIVFNSVLVDRLPERRRMLARGLADGIRGRMGKLDD